MQKENDYPVKKNLTTLFNPPSQLSGKLYLTIDDGPSEHTDEIVQLLKSNDIPAIFFFRGDSLIDRMDIAINAIQNGFLIGNHSYTHTAYSKMPASEFFNEIMKTELLIEKCYSEANIKREFKLIRLPYGDRGAGDYLAKPTNSIQEQKVTILQEFLQDNGFQPLDFSDVTNKEDSMIDAMWTIDTKDYLSKYKENETLYLNNLNKALLESTTNSNIVLMHDFRDSLGRSDHLIKCGIQFLLNQNILFLPFQIRACTNITEGLFQSS